MFVRRFALLAYVATLVPAMAGDASDKVDEVELRKLQGKWESVSTVVDGKELKKDETSGFSYVLEGRVLTLFVRGKEAGKMEIKHLVNAEPSGQLDAERTEVNGKAVTDGRVKMLYKLDGETLTTCAGSVGAERPDEFASKPGSKTRLSVIKIKNK